MESFDINKLPLPNKIPEDEVQLEWTSVVFNKLRANETLSMSKKAITPFWLNKNMYHNLVDVDIQFPLPIVKTNDWAVLQKKYDKFSSFEKYRK